ncbi:MAG: carboxylating nicotinate-nucleotide diphosphorylase [Alphaproteobacteria bacterium]|nr:carboxylating nicotinate-nucleotide diphosphorylase [Alphaproteobacteria bacterium]
MTVAPLYPSSYAPIIARALEEDFGAAGDITTDSIVAPDAKASASIVGRREGRVAGLDVALAVFTTLDSAVTAEFGHHDGEDVLAGARLAVISGPARVLLSGERTALNLLGRMSGIATTTRDLTVAVGDHKARIVCTRKTAPGLRLLDKYAVRAGGGVNHRFGLGDGVLIKDNHRIMAGGVGPAIERVRQRLGHMVKVEVEVDTLAELEEALGLGVDAVLLDNMTPELLTEAVLLVGGRVVTEASGGITPDTVANVAAAGVDLISLGWLTHSVTNWDVGLDFEPQ